jgi:Flp pilus assembly protein TadB
MLLLYLLAAVFGLLILVLLLAIIQMEDQGARLRLKSRLLRVGPAPRVSLGESLLPLLDAIQAPSWYEDWINSQTLAWSGIRFSKRQFQSLWWLLSLLGLSLGVLLAVVTSGSTAGTLLGLLSLLGGLASPYYYLQRRIRARRRMVERSLPDFLDMLSFTIEAGLGLVPAIKRVTAGSQGVLSAEMELALLQIDLGYSQKEALQELSRRVPSDDLEHFVEAILLAERLGTSLARTMRVQSGLLRTRRRQRAEVQAQTAPIRIIPALVFFFLPGLLLIYLAPPIINFLLRR